MSVSMIEHTRYGIGECKTTLIVGSNTDGSLGFDSGSWRRLAERGKTMFDDCVSLRQSGDAQGVGARVAGISVSRRGVWNCDMLTRHLKGIVDPPSWSSTPGALPSISRLEA